MLTDLQVAKLKHEGKSRIEKHPDRDGLILAISPPHKSDPRAKYGSKVWRYSFRWPPTAKGKWQTISYGRYPELSLADARQKHTEARRAIASGINPAEAKQKQKLAILAELDNTYEKVAASWYANAKAEKSQSWMDNNDRWLTTINKTLGGKTLHSITDEDVHRAISPLLDSGYAFSAERARQQIALVFDFAKRKPWRYSGPNPARDLRGHIKVPKHKNHSHISEQEIKEFLRAADSSGGSEQTKIATRLLLLTFTRKQELLAAKKSELDLNAGLWEIPAERMKNRVPHLVPLSKQAVALFKRQLELAAKAGKSEYVFPNTQRPGHHAGLSTLNRFFSRIGYGDRLTPHGLRTVASTKLNGTRKFSGDVIERQLSHVELDKIRGAYNKADHLPERTEAMQFWADHVDWLCSKADDTNVIQLDIPAAA